MLKRLVSGLFGLAICAVALGSLPQQAHAAGNLKFCAKWRYQFTDQGLGEDKLLHNNGSTGIIDAAYSWAVIKRDGTTVWSGYTDASGCTGTISGTAGNYQHWRTAAMRSGSKFIWIRPNDGNAWEWFSQTVNLSSGVPNGNTWTYTPYVGFGATSASVAAVMTEAIKRSDVGLINHTYKLYSNQDCPQGGHAGCYNYSAVYLGDDNFGNLVGFNKTITAHEMGHYVQDKMFGYLSNNYNENASEPICRCDHVQTANALHCMQSREDISAAQVEGWAQFFAMNLFNNNNEFDAVFAYYKEFLFFGVIPPPVALHLHNPVKWTESFCPEAESGSELDWTTFYWDINNKGSNKYSFSNLESVYENACGGECFGHHISWPDLSTAVNNVYGSTSSKAQRFHTTADAHGVNW